MHNIVFLAFCTLFGEAKGNLTWHLSWKPLNKNFVSTNLFYTYDQPQETKIKMKVTYFHTESTTHLKEPWVKQNSSLSHTYTMSKLINNEYLHWVSYQSTMQIWIIEHTLRFPSLSLSHWVVLEGKVVMIFSSLKQHGKGKKKTEETDFLACWKIVYLKKKIQLIFRTTDPEFMWLSTKSYQ